MLFSSMIFVWIFLPIVFLVNLFLHEVGGAKCSNIWLLLASLFFYSWGEPVYVLLMIFSIMLNWLSGLLVSRLEKYKKLIVALCVLGNIGLLGYFKYTNMIIDTINNIAKTSIKCPEIILPIGISFFTFQALSYVIDVYRKDCDVQKNPLKLALYISFFPQLIAGPIVKYKDISNQIETRKITLENVAYGVRRFIYGFAKKVLLSNVLAECADRIYDVDVNDLSGAMIWVAALCYTFQIYYDFSGYSDMAIGLGQMFGFKFEENFNYPYTSLSITEFWRRWHISLGTWFREYVYIPLGGNRKGKIRTYINLFIVFFLTGLWHGASWNFVFWGLYFGVFMIIERVGVNKILQKVPIISYIYMFLVVNVGWVFFRIEGISNAFTYIKMMFTPWNYTAKDVYLIDYFDHRALFTLICGILGMGFIQRIMIKKDKLVRKWKFSVLELIYCMVLMLLAYMSLASNSYNPFIYFRF